MSLVKFNQDSPLQKIRASFLDDSIILTDKQEEVKEQIRFTYTLRLKNKYSPSQAVEMLQKQYGVSQATAYRLYRKAMYVFGEINDTDLKAEKRIIVEHKWNLYQLALKDRDVELANKILDEYYKMFDFTEKDETDKGKLKPHSYNVVIDRDVRKALRDQLLRKGVVDFNSYPEAEDIDYKDVVDGEEDS